MRRLDPSLYAAGVSSTNPPPTTQITTATNTQHVDQEMAKKHNRVLRHRASEARRKQRIKHAVGELKRLTGSKSDEMASILYDTVDYIELVQKGGTAMPFAAKGPQAGQALTTNPATAFQFTDLQNTPQHHRSSAEMLGDHVGRADSSQPPPRRVFVNASLPQGHYQYQQAPMQVTSSTHIPRFVEEFVKSPSGKQPSQPHSQEEQEGSSKGREWISQSQPTILSSEGMRESDTQGNISPVASGNIVQESSQVHVHVAEALHSVLHDDGKFSSQQSNTAPE